MKLTSTQLQAAAIIAAVLLLTHGADKLKEVLYPPQVTDFYSLQEQHRSLTALIKSTENPAKPKNMNAFREISASSSSEAGAKGEKPGQHQFPAKSARVTNGAKELININTAGLDELTQLPRIGPSIAARIIAYRTEYGPFQNTADLTKVRGIGKKTLETLQQFIWVTERIQK